MTISFQISPFDPSRDSGQLIEFIDASDWTRVEQLARLSDCGDFFALVAISTRPIGWIVVHTAFRPDLGWLPDEDTLRFQSGDNAYLEHIHVRSNFRGMGCGSALLAAAEDLARHMGKRELWLHVSPDNQLARSFYRSRKWRFEYITNPEWRERQPMEVWAKAL